MKIAFGLFLIVLTLHAVEAQNAAHKVRWLPRDTAGFRHFYFFWGYNRASFSKSDLHLNGPDYDFTVYGVTAHDRPSAFRPGLYFSPTTLSIPQYNARMGWFFRRHWALALGVDHMKYVMDRNQTARVSGIVTREASDTYAKAYLNDPVVLKEDFLKFEHTDGLNLFTLDLEYHRPILWLTGHSFALTAYAGIGGLVVMPRTDVRVFGDGLNNRFHVAGYAMTTKVGIKVFVLRNLFLLFENKVGSIHLPSILLKNDAPQRADQNFFFWEKIGALGFQYNLNRKKKK